MCGYLVGVGVLERATDPTFKNLKPRSRATNLYLPVGFQPFSRPAGAPSGGGVEGVVEPRSVLSNRSNRTHSMKR
jgi:hypothetical protein